MPTALTRLQMTAQLVSHGHHYLESDAAALNRFIQLSAEDILHGEPWPHRNIIAVATIPDGTGTLASIENLGDVQQVMWTTAVSGVGPWTVLDPTTLDELYDQNAMQLVGLPTKFALKGPETLFLNPAPPGGSGSVVIRSRTRACWQTTGGVIHGSSSVVDGDVLLGNRGDFDEAVILGARTRILEDTDEIELREALNARLDRELIKLRDQLLNSVVDEPKFIKQTRAWE